MVSRESRDLDVIMGAGVGAAVNVNKHVTASGRETECAETSSPGQQTDGLRIRVVPVNDIDGGIKISVDVGWKARHAGRPYGSGIRTGHRLQAIGVATRKSPCVLCPCTKDCVDRVKMSPRDRR